MVRVFSARDPLNVLVAKHVGTKFVLDVPATLNARPRVLPVVT